MGTTVVVLLLLSVVCGHAHRAHPEYETRPETSCYDVRAWGSPELSAWVATLSIPPANVDRNAFPDLLDGRMGSPMLIAYLNNTIHAELAAAQLKPQDICLFNYAMREVLQHGRSHRLWTPLTMDSVHYELDKCCGFREHRKQAVARAVHAALSVAGPVGGVLVPYLTPYVAAASFVQSLFVVVGFLAVASGVSRHTADTVDTRALLELLTEWGQIATEVAGFGKCEPEALYNCACAVTVLAAAVFLRLKWRHRTSEATTTS